MPVIAYILTALGAYLLGSIPFGFLVAKAKGIDIRSVGSGNIGATNAMRVLGKPAGIFVLLMDAAKGFVATVYMAPLVHGWIAPDVAEKSLGLNLFVFAGVCAVLGHNYTCWLKFKGGKGIATSAGVLTAMVPWALVIILSLWIILFLATRFVSIGSLAASFTLPFATWFTTRDVTLTIVSGALGVLAIYKHKTNIQRLLDGTESRVSFGRKEDEK